MTMNRSLTKLVRRPLSTRCVRVGRLTSANTSSRLESRQFSAGGVSNEEGKPHTPVSNSEPELGTATEVDITAGDGNVSKGETKTDTALKVHSKAQKGTLSKSESKIDKAPKVQKVYPKAENASPSNSKTKLDTAGKENEKRAATTAKLFPPVIRIKDATFYRQHPDSAMTNPNANQPLFKNLNFYLQTSTLGSEERDAGVVGTRPARNWAIIGPSGSGKTTFLQVLQGKHLCFPADGIKWPWLTGNGFRGPRASISQGIKRVGFDGESGFREKTLNGAYLSARYESRREIEDFSLLDYLRGNTELNAFEDLKEPVKQDLLERVVKDLDLLDLVGMPLSNLSNGQTRRARIAKALLSEPELLLLDEPFMGLDPRTILTLNPILRVLAETSRPRILLTLRPQDPIPDWVHWLIVLKGNCEIALMGRKRHVLHGLQKIRTNAKMGMVSPDPGSPYQTLKQVGRIWTDEGIHELPQVRISSRMMSPQSQVDEKLQDEMLLDGMADEKTSERKIGKPSRQKSLSARGVEAMKVKAKKEAAETAPQRSRDGYLLQDPGGSTINRPSSPEPIVEMEGAVVSYGTKTVLGNWSQPIDGEDKPGLWWKVHRGERWGIFGPNGSGKTTLLSLITSDHPKSYSLPIKQFGRSRVQQEGGQPPFPLFELQSKIGQSSPEINNHIPRSFTIREVLENAYSETLRGRPTLTEKDTLRITRCLLWFEQDIRPNAPRDFKFRHPMTLDHVDEYLKRSTAWADEHLFGSLPLGAQRVLLFLRAIVKQPDIIILDEAFSGMDDGVRDRCLLFLSKGELFKHHVGAHGELGFRKSGLAKAREVEVWGLDSSQALIVVSHVKEEIPGGVRNWICLPEASTGLPPRTGVLGGPIEGDEEGWKNIWGM